MKNKKLKVLVVSISLIFLIICMTINWINIRQNKKIDIEILGLDYKTESNVTFSVEVEKKTNEHVIACLIFEDKIDGIEEIESPKGNKTNTPGKTKIAVDYKLKLNTEETFKIKSKSGEITNIPIKANDYIYDGDGTASNPYIIKTAVLLQRVKEDLDAHYKLGANIDLSDREWIIIGNDLTPFSGSIDGDGYTISNLTVESTGNNVGLFGKSTGVIKNIAVENFNVKGNSNVGTIVGQTTNTINNCKVTESTVTATGDNVGGIVGYTTGDVTNSIAEVSVVGGNQVGGVIGHAYASGRTLTVTGNNATGNVVGNGENVGGLIGKSQAHSVYGSGASKINISTSYATGKVTATGDNVGGLIGIVTAQTSSGYFSVSVNVNISECYATGEVETKGSNTGGLIGYIYEYYAYYYSQHLNVVIQNVYETGKVTGANNIGGLIGYIYKSGYYESRQTSTVNMQITNSYAVGEVTGTVTGGLVGKAATSNNPKGSNTVTNSYWTPETTKQPQSIYGTGKDIQRILYKAGYDNWDFEAIWAIEENETLAYLRNVDKPDNVNKENLKYEVYEIIGTGTTSDPYIITTSVQLQKINGDLAANYKIAANIDLSGREWEAIGNTIYTFTGSLDGAGYTISNLTIDSTSDNQGLFGVVTLGEINNITIENFNIKGNSNIGTLIGNVTGTAQINNCNVKGSVVEGTGVNVGGLVGYTTRKIATSEITDTEVKGTTQVGGLVGNTTGEIDNVILEEVKASGTIQVGGLVGNTTNAVSNITANIEVTGTENQVGGLIGNITNTINEVTVKGQVSGADQIGGVVGYTTSTITEADIQDLTVTGRSQIGGVVGQSTNTISTINVLGNVNVTGTGDNVGGAVGYTADAISGVTTDQLIINGINQVGGIAGYSTGTIESVNATNLTISGTGNIGGVVGKTTNATNNCKVTGSTVTGEGDNVGGVVGYTTGNVTNLIAEVSVVGANQVGGVIGHAYASGRTLTATGNSATGNVVGNGQNAGGLIGKAEACSVNGSSSKIDVEKSYATGKVTATGDNVGGLIGDVTAKTKNNDYTKVNINIIQNYATGEVETKGNNVGGLIGYLYEYYAYYYNQHLNVVIQNVYETGKVTGANNIGGLIGYIYKSGYYESRQTSTVNMQITNSYAVGEVTGTVTGGLVGKAATSNKPKGSNTVTNSYWVPETTKQTASALGESISIELLLTQSGYNSWDFTSIWTIEENSTLAYLRNLPKPESVKKENWQY